MSPLLCLAVAVYFEARGEPLEGQYAVAQVITNRVEDGRYPDDICSVVAEPHQFSFTTPLGLPVLPDNSAGEIALGVARDVLEGDLPQITSTHYHTLTVNPNWAKYYDVDGIIGGHIFYTNNTRYK